MRLAAEEEVALRVFQRVWESASAEEAEAFLLTVIRIQQPLVAHEHLRRQYAAGESGGWQIPGTDGYGGVGLPLEPTLSDEQIETLAVKAVARFALLEPSEAERSWAAWREELYRRVPPLAAEEVERRAAEMRGRVG